MVKIQGKGMGPFCCCPDLYIALLSGEPEKEMVHVHVLPAAICHLQLACTMVQGVIVVTLTLVLGLGALASHC